MTRLCASTRRSRGAGRRRRARRDPLERPARDRRGLNRWRVEKAWWREPIARDYFKVVGTRWLALVYLDRVDGSWHGTPLRLTPWTSRTTGSAIPSVRLRTKRTTKTATTRPRAARSLECADCTSPLPARSRRAAARKRQDRARAGHALRGGTANIAATHHARTAGGPPHIGSPSLVRLPWRALTWSVRPVGDPVHVQGVAHPSWSGPAGRHRRGEPQAGLQAWSRSPLAHGRQ